MSSALATNKREAPGSAFSSGLSNHLIRKPQGDRFIPARSAMDMEVGKFTMTWQPKETSTSSSGVPFSVKEEYRRKLAESLLHSSNGKRSKILIFKRKLKTGSRQGFLFDELFKDDYHLASKTYRDLPKSPDRVLDAPDLVDDYYLNLLDWGCNNIIAVALGSTLYLWNAENAHIEQLMQTNGENDYLTSVSWAPDGKHIAIGLNNTEVQLWDANKLKLLRKLGGHSARIGSLAWNGPILSSGSRDSLIINHDVRVRDHLVSQFQGHSQEVCGLKWSDSGQQLASGGNDNLLHIWDVKAMSSSSSSGTQYLHRCNKHQAAVKALAWCPYQANLLASGGGTADRCIKFWNTQTGVCVNNQDTRSQVCALQWNRHQKELLSSHGFSQNQLCLWKYPAMVKVGELTGHTARVLHLAQSPDGTTVVSAGADETLRFWKLFCIPNRSSLKTIKSEESVLSLKTNHIR